MSPLTQDDLVLMVQQVNKTDLPALDYYSQTGEYLMHTMRNMEEDVIKHVLGQYLERDVRLDDAKKCVRYFQERDNNKYALVYNGIILGMISIGHLGLEFNVTFTPSKEFE